MNTTETILTAIIWIGYGLYAANTTFHSRTNKDTSILEDCWSNNNNIADLAIGLVMLSVIGAPVVLAYRMVSGVFRNHYQKD